jgi:hypothetical protein
MSTVKRTVIAVALITAAGLTAVPAYANEGQKPVENAGHVEQAKAVCTTPELKAFIADKLENAKKAEAARQAERQNGEHKTGEKARSLRAEGTPPTGGGLEGTAPATGDGTHETKKPESTDAAANREAAAKAEAAHKAEKAKKRQADEKAYLLNKLAKACGEAKAEKLARAKKEAERLARERRFQAIGVVVSNDPSGGVTVLIKAGSRDLHNRKLSIIVTAETQIKVDGETAALKDLVPGVYVSVHGLRSEGNLAAFKINAATPGTGESPEPAPSTTPSGDVK